MVAIFSAAGFFVHSPFGPRKSGMPESVEMPAPVSTTIRSAVSRCCLAAATPTGSWLIRAAPVHQCAQPSNHHDSPERPATVGDILRLVLRLVDPMLEPL